MRIAIMGSGGIGGMCGARLAAHGADVLFIARGQHLAVMQNSGLRLQSALGDVVVDHIEATDDPDGQRPVDICLFTIKGPDTDAAIDLIAPIVGAHTGIISFQNGVDGIEKLAARFGSNAILPGATTATATIVAPGVIQHAGTSNNFTFGEWDGTATRRARAYRDIAQSSGLATQISAMPLTDVWLKYAAASGGMATTCLSRSPLRSCVERTETRELFTGAMQEVYALARAKGLQLPPEHIDRMVSLCLTLDPGWKTSMLTDLEAGKAIEIEAMFGAAHRMGVNLGVPTPILSVAYRALKHYGERKT